MSGADETNAAITISGLSFMINPDMKTPAIMPTAAPRPEKPAPMPSDVILKENISEVIKVQTKVSRHVYKTDCFETPDLRKRYMVTAKPIITEPITIGA